MNKDLDGQGPAAVETCNGRWRGEGNQWWMIHRRDGFVYLDNWDWEGPRVEWDPNGVRARFFILKARDVAVAERIIRENPGGIASHPKAIEYTPNEVIKDLEMVE